MKKNFIIWGGNAASQWSAAAIEVSAAAAEE
jgi:hypothetical protein